MTVRDYVRIVREQWIVIAAAVMVTVLAAGAVWFIRSAEYTARLTMYVSAQSADTAQTAYQGSLLSQQRVTSYVELVSSTRVSSEVIQRLGLAGTPEDVAETISASAPLDSVLIDVAVIGTSPFEVAAVANAVGAVLIQLVDELDRPASPTAVPPVAVRVVQPAVPPIEPSSAGLPLTLALGLLTGLALGIGAAFARNALDNTVKSLDQLRQITDAPNLGSIAFDSNVPARPLTVHESPQSPRSEAFRHLRTNLQFVDVDNPCKIIVVTSSVPTEGKTTTLCNLAIAMSSTGSRVLVIEADLRRPKLADLFGLDRAAGLTTVLSGKVHLEDAIQHWADGVLDVLASGPLPPNPSELLASKQMKDLFEKLRGMYDIVLVDTPPLLPVTDAAAVAPAADGVILVCRFRDTRRDQIKSATGSLEAVSAPLLGTVLCMVPSSGPGAYADYDTYYRTDQMPLRNVPVPAPEEPVNGVQRPTQVPVPTRRY